MENKKKYSTRVLLLTIPLMKHLFTYLPDRGENYKLILDYLVINDFSKEDINLKPTNEIHRELKMTPSVFKKNLDQIYQDQLNLLFCSENKYWNLGHECLLYCEGYGEYVTISCNLKILPRVGEEVHIPFLRPIYNPDVFFVLKIDHELNSDKQITSIWLKNGFYNKYAALEIDKQRFIRLNRKWQEFELEKYDLFKIL
jgi:hypothetical protein